jgi:hypothetical protein
MSERRAPAATPGPASEAAPPADWNELAFVGWDEFRRMAPSILQLEITRLDALLSELGRGASAYNDLVRVRYCVRRFVACLEAAHKDTLRAACAAHLQAAIMGLSLPPAGVEEGARETWRYVLDRLRDVYRRLPLVY